MKPALILGIVLTSSLGVFAQDPGNALYFQSAGPVATVGMGVVGRGPVAPVEGAPYSATITNESIQTLGDGTQITQSMSGSVARDSEGRTRQDAPLPVVANMAAGDAPHLVFIQDPVAQTAFTLNLTDKTAQKMPAVPMLPPNRSGSTSGATAGGGKVILQMSGSVPPGAALPDPPPEGVMVQRTFIGSDQGKVTTEDLGSQTMEGVQVTGVRTTRTIAAGEIGNDRPITIVTEVWTSADLKAIVFSKRSDPRTGDQTFKLTNIVRSEPDASLFTVPGDFKIVEGPQRFLFRTNP
jgi:hypothetical protein